MLGDTYFNVALINVWFRMDPPLPLCWRKVNSDLMKSKMLSKVLIIQDITLISQGSALNRNTIM